MHPHQDITTPHKFPFDIKLRYRRPITIFFNAAPQLRIFKYIESAEFGRVNALQAEYLDRSTREAALWGFGSAFHEENDGGGGDGARDGGPSLGGEVPGEGGGEKGVAEERVADMEGGSGEGQRSGGGCAEGGADPVDGLG